MKHRFKKPVFRYLLEIARDGDGDPAGKIIQNLSRQTANANVQYQLCVSAVKKLEEKAFVPHREAERIIDFVCNNVKRVGVYDKGTANKIRNLILTDETIRNSYAEIAEAFVFILDDRDKAEAILRQAFEILKGEVQNRTRHTLICESDREGISKDEHYSCSTMDFIRVAYCWINTAQDKSYAVTIANYGSKYAQGFFENLELGEFYILFPEERYTAFKFFRRAEELTSDFDDNWCLCHNLFLSVKNEEWCRQVMEKCKASAVTSDDLCRIAELYGSKQGMPNLEMSQQYFRLAMEKAKTDEERRSVQDSIDNVLEENGIE